VSRCFPRVTITCSGRGIPVMLSTQTSVLKVTSSGSLPIDAT
jgi:hypothetical protein